MCGVTETEIIPNFVIKVSLCINHINMVHYYISNRKNKEYLPFIVYILIRKFIKQRILNETFSRFRYIFKSFRKDSNLPLGFIYVIQAFLQMTFGVLSVLCVVSRCSVNTMYGI